LRRHWRGLMLGTALGAVVFAWVSALFFPSPGVDEKAYLPEVYPETYAFSEKGGSPPVYEAYTLDGDGGQIVLGAVFRSTEVADVPRGYAGPVPVLVGLDRRGTITGVRILGHKETPSYAANLEKPEFLSPFIGKNAGDTLRLDRDIDGVTRATVTAAAVVNGVRISSRAVATDTMGLVVPEEKVSPAPVPWLPLAAFALLVAAAVASIVRKNSVLRWFSLLLGLAVLGFWQGTYLSTATAVNILLGRFPSFREHLLWYALAIVGIGAAAAWRNIYCARMCPFGALQECLHLFSIRPLAAGADEERESRRLRYVFLWLVVLAVFLFGRSEAANYEPFSTAFDFKGGTLRWIFLGLVLLLAGLRHRFWCRYFCPTGVWLQLLGRMRARNPFD
jgi:NosR/NirI family nitrous oxide reductase transcriptional regulator